MDQREHTTAVESVAVPPELLEEAIRCAEGMHWLNAPFGAKSFGVLAENLKACRSQPIPEKP